MYGMFGHELIDNATARRVAETAYAGLYDPAWKMFRTCLPAGSFYSQFEFIYAHWLQGLSKLFRITRHQKGLLAIRDSYEFHFGKFCNFPESFNMKPDLTLEQHGAGGWFIETLGTRYQVILENLYGINLTPDNLGICPWGIHTGKMRLENLTAGKSRWSFDYRGRGEWPEKILLDGKNYPSSWVFPGRTLNGGSHTVEVVFGDNKPSHQVLLEAAGVELVDAKVKNSILKVRVQGTGRAYLRFFCPDEPTVRINGKPVKHVWDPVSQQAVIEVTSINGLEIELENRNSHTLN